MLAQGSYRRNGGDEVKYGKFNRNHERARNRGNRVRSTGALQAFCQSRKWIRLIPLWAALLGVVFGIVAFYAVPGIMPADNVLVAILIGGASGLAATGTNQIYKQLTKDKDKSDNEKSK